MKAEELMIGDWLTGQPDNRIVKVIELKDNDIVCNQRCFDLEPIEITPKILEKNGFCYLEDKHCFFNLKIGLHPMKYGKYAPYRVGNIVMFINYVHELQHIMRLCGIDKEIEL